MLGVDARVARHEGRAEAGREGRLRLGHAALGAGDARGVAGQEMVHRLLGGEQADRRQHAERVGGQHDDVGSGWPARPVAAGVRDELERVAAARVLGQAVVVEARRCRRAVEDDVLQHRAEPRRGGVDLRLGRGVEPDHLGVAAALEVEDAVRTPAMLVVADQRAARRRPRAWSCRCRTGRRTRPPGRPAPTLAEQCIGSTPAAGRR